MAVFISETSFRADITDYLVKTQLSYTLVFPAYYYSVRVYFSLFGCSYSD
jgi:hypothetical protein